MYESSENIKSRAIELRKLGHTYTEIAAKIHISKSTLSGWLSSIPLTQTQENRIAKKRLEYAKLGGRKRREMRMESTKQIIDQAIHEIGNVSERELFLIGISLYWAEGAKQKLHNISQRVCFSSSDPKMVKIFSVWLDRICKLEEDDQRYELYIHTSKDTEEAVNFWKSILAAKDKDIKVYFKKHALSTNRKNINQDYYGQLRIIVRKSTDLNRKISGWIQGIYNKWGMV